MATAGGGAGTDNEATTDCDYIIDAVAGVESDDVAYLEYTFTPDVGGTGTGQRVVATIGDSTLTVQKVTGGWNVNGTIVDEKNSTSQTLSGFYSSFPTLISGSEEITDEIDGDNGGLGFGVTVTTFSKATGTEIPSGRTRDSKIHITAVAKLYD